MTYKAPIAIGLLFLQLSWVAGAATLRPETKAAWDSYMAQANAAMQSRLHPGNHFLWMDDHPGVADLVRARGFYVSPAAKEVPKKIPTGLIHDWIGVSFVPNARIDDVVRVLRDYDHYKDVYHHGVVQSSLQSTDGVHDLFSLRLVNGGAVAKTALDADSEATYIRVDDHRMYAVSNTLRMREVAKFGSPEEHLLPEDQGIGLIWRLSSFTRLEERDGGVYTELEAVALSRDIPGAVRIFVTPIVRRVSRDSLATSLTQTRDAVDNALARHTVATGSVTAFR